MKKGYVLIMLVFFCQSGLFSDSFRLSPDFRPVKITIYWVGFNEEMEHTDYAYNKKGQVVKASVYRGENSPAWYDKMEYDDSNRLIKKSIFSSAGLSSYTTFSYIDNKLFEEVEYDPEGNYKRVTSYEYNEKGNIISISLKEVPYNGKYLSWNTLEFFFYDPFYEPSSGTEQRISERLEYYDGSLHNRTLYDYKKDSLILNTFSYGDLRDVISKTETRYTYHAKGKNKDKLSELSNISISYYNGKESIECCTTYTMKPEYGSKGNMTKLMFYNCDNERTGFAVIVWEKGKTDLTFIKKIFKQIHWHFTGC